MRACVELRELTQRADQLELACALISFLVVGEADAVAYLLPLKPATRQVAVLQQQVEHASIAREACREPCNAPS